MPYTDPWTDSIPADSAAANTIGAQLRQLRLDLHERINTLIGQSVLSTALADPLMPAYVPSLFIPVWEMRDEDSIGGRVAVTLVDGGLEIAHAIQVTGTFRAKILLPSLCVLGNVIAYAKVNTGTLTMSVDVYNLPFSTSTIGGSVALNHIGTTSSAGLASGFRTVTCVGQAGTVINAGDAYYMQIEVIPSSGGGDNTWFFGAMIEYTRPIANQGY